MANNSSLQADVPNDEPATPRPKKFNRLWWLATAFALFVVWFCWQLFGPNPPIIVSKQTTYITTPLRPDGRPDYPQYVRDLYAANVRPAENAAVLLWQAILPEHVVKANVPRVVEELGLPGNSDYSDRISPHFEKALSEDVWYWYSEKFIADQFAPTDFPYGEACDQIIEMAQSCPWRTEDAPPLSRWLDDHQAQLDLILEASHRPKFYAPSPELLRQSDPLLLSAWPSCLIEFSLVPAKGLSIRAMRHLGEGRCGAAWTDILALYRLAHLFHQGHNLFQRERAFVLESAAHEATLAFLFSNTITPDQFRQALQDIANLPAIPSFAPCIDQLDRVEALDAILHLNAGDSEELFKVLELGDEVQIIDHVSVDWNFVLREVNRWFDRLGAALQRPDYQSRQQAIRAIYNDLTQAGNAYQGVSDFAPLTISRRQRSQFLALAAISMLPGSVPLQEQARADARRAMISLVGALTQYRAAHGAYPKSLLDLIPAFLPALPIDPFTGSSFLYHPDMKGYLLYGAGDNGIDNGGSNDAWDIFAGRKLNWNNDPAIEELRKQIPRGADDIAIRVPRPAFQLPSAPAGATGQR